MVRARLLSWFDWIAETVLAVAGVLALLVFFFVAWICAEGRWIAVLLGMLCMSLQGCSTPPAPAADPRDPDVYRPVNPQYPMPQ